MAPRVRGNGGTSATKSTTCFGKQTKQPVTQYDTKEDAIDGATYANSKHGSDLTVYQCNVCNYWHLSPRSRQTKMTSSRTASSGCHCCDSNNQRKHAYLSKGDAQRRAQILKDEHRVDSRNASSSSLNVYQCPDNVNLWHLTSVDPNEYKERETQHLQRQQQHQQLVARIKKSTTCVGKQTKKPLTEYDTQQEAQDGSDYICKQYGGDLMIPYHCPTCSKWHLGKRIATTTI